MIICINCKKEMVCIKNGVDVRYGKDHTHAYSGDLYECSKCYYKVVFTNTTPRYDEFIKPSDILMENQS